MGTTCFVHTCDSLSGWTIDPAIQAALDTITKKQGAASIKFTKPVSPGGGKDCYISAAQCDNYLGYWIYLAMTQEMAGLSLFTRNAAGSLAGESFLYSSPPTITMGRFLYTIDDGILSGTRTQITNNAWHWIEKYYDPVQPFVDWHDNGIARGSIVGRNVKNYTHFYLEGAAADPAWITWLDYIRIYSQYEYPPIVPPTKKLHPFWKLKT